MEFDPAAKPGLLALAGMEDELSHVMGRMGADLRTAQDLSRHFHDEVVATAQARYAG